MAAFTTENFPSGTLAAGTFQIPLLVPQGGPLYVFGFSVQQFTLLAATTVTMQLIRYTGTNGGTTVNLTNAQDITATVCTAKVAFNIPLITTLTDANRLILPGDSVFGQLVITGSVTTQSVGGAVALDVGYIN